MANNTRISSTDVIELAKLLNDSFEYETIVSIVEELGIEESELPVLDRRTPVGRIESIVKHLNKNLMVHVLLENIIQKKPKLKEFQKFRTKLPDSAPEVDQQPSSPTLARQRTIDKENQLLKSPLWWLGEARSALGKVCRLEFHARNDTYTGTGFLVGADLILTNYHLVKSFIDGKDDIDKIIVRFDYFYDEDKITPRSGKEYRLFPKYWSIDYSKDSDFDSQVDPKELPHENELDYAILCVKGLPGIENTGAGKAALRGWINIPAEEEINIKVGNALHIVQHPDGDPLQLAIDTSSVISVNQNGTRVRYKTNTNFGSSGSPCFNQDWKVIALHQAGDPNFQKNHIPQYNQGIPIAAIRKLLASKGKLGYLGRSEPYLLSRMEQELPPVHPYVKKLYEETLIRNSPQIAEKLLDWLENFPTGPGYKWRGTTKRHWLLTVIDKHIELFDQNIISQIIKIREKIINKAGNSGEIEMKEYDLSGVEDVIPYRYLALMFKETALLLLTSSSVLIDFKEKCRTIRSHAPLVQGAREQLEIIRDQVERTFGYYQIYEFNNKHLSQKLESFELKFMYEQITDAINNLEGQIDTLNTDLKLNRQATLRKLESLFSDVIHYLREYAECLHKSMQVRT